MVTPSQFTGSGEPPHIETSSTPRWILILFVIAFLFVIYLTYASVTSRQALQKGFDDSNKHEQALAAELDKTNARIADLKGEMDVTTQKLGLTQDELAHARALAQQVRKDQKQSDEQLKTQIGAVQADTATKFGEVSTELSGTKSDVAATKADLEATKAKLSSTVGDLGVQSGLIARNHEEVEELKRLGERNIYEFKIKKSNQMQRVGPIQVTLRKVDTKKYKYTMNVLADDKTIEKKDKTAGEPVQFYVHGSRAPFEIVVFDVTKDQIGGYLSTPKDSAPPAAATPPGN
jgi:chromosome segregation ATPase